MSISILKYIFECQEIKASGNYSIGLEFLHKSSLYSLMNKTITNYTTMKK